ncbi:MAG: hypothetical protein DHS20C12_28880 [Pseudohongiella sp.]|nr:MAG: hypothetical protein DHS20C12_28880 [Pseudohongiella sp.]
MLLITSIAAAILGLLLVRLSLNVIGFRRSLGVSLGDGGEEALQRAMRAQGNLAEYGPMGLILIACIELNGAPWWLTAVLATMFVVGRLLHPLGMKDAGRPTQPRVRGMQLTLISMLGMGIVVVVLVAMNLFAA